MNDDLLSRATRALRETVDGTKDDARATEDRILSRLPRSRRLRLVRPWGFSLAALLIGSSVWAMGGGAPLTAWLGQLTDASPTTPARTQDAGPKRHAPRKVASSPSPSTVDLATEVAEPAPTPRVEPAAAPAPSTRRPVLATQAHEPAPEPPPATVRPSPPADPVEPTAVPPASSSEATDQSSEALDVYEQAHDLHFKVRDYARALGAWDRYLGLAPTGSLALEARFHRGVCLARLGHTHAARLALEPFARGVYGTYRQAQAQKLLDGASP